MVRKSIASAVKRTRGDRFVAKEFQIVKDQLRSVEAAVGRLGEAGNGRGNDVGSCSEQDRDSGVQDGEDRAATHTDSVRDSGGPFDMAKPEVHEIFENPRPWMVDAAVEHVASVLQPTMTAIEWGGGASTPFWCQRVGVLHTYEASPGWALILLDYMRRYPALVDRWRFHFVGANWASTTVDKRRTGRRLPPEPVKSRLTADYASVIPDQVDAVIVDGSVRQATLAAAATYVDRDRPLVVVVDNTDKQYVVNALPDLVTRGYERHDYPPTGDAEQPKRREVQSQTSVWIRRDSEQD